MLLDVTAGVQPRYHLKCVHVINEHMEGLVIVTTLSRKVRDARLLVYLGRFLRAASILTLLLLAIRFNPIFQHYSLFFRLSKSPSLVGFSSSFRAKAEIFDRNSKGLTCLTPAGKKWKATAMEATRPSPVAPLLPRAINHSSEITFSPDHI